MRRATKLGGSVPRRAALMRLPRMLEPLRIRDFALLWAGMSVSLVGDAIFVVALAWQVYELSNEPSALGWVMAAYLTPMVVFLLVGGVLTDRIERRKMMIAADAIRALAIGTAGALAVSGTLELWQLAICAAAIGVGDALFAPAFGSIVPEIVPREQLAQANALDQFMRPIAGVIGPAIAGMLIAVSGAGAALLVDAVTFVASIGAALMLTPRPFEHREDRSAWRDVREGSRSSARVHGCGPRSRSRGSSTSRPRRGTCCCRSWSRTTCTGRPRRSAPSTRRPPQARSCRRSSTASAACRGASYS